MRIWDLVPATALCRKHLLGEHRELHGLWNILILGKSGYANHPETRRWVGHESALAQRHTELACEMLRRGYSHKSPLLAPATEEPFSFSVGRQSSTTVHVIRGCCAPAPWDDQLAVLRVKGCACEVR